METLKSNKDGRKRMFEILMASNGCCNVKVIDGTNYLTTQNDEVIISEKLYSDLRERNILI